MALDVTGQKSYCKITHTENGRSWTRRVHTMMIQAANGKLYHLTGKDLPDSISFYSGVPYTGAHVAEVLLNPRCAFGIPLVATSTLRMRDVCFMGLGMFFLGLIMTLAEAAATALTF